MFMNSNRPALEARWLHLTRVVMPKLAATRRWPVRHDHCFQRILLDAACGARWTDHVEGRPAYRRIDDARLARAVALAEDTIEGCADLSTLNRESLRWRGRALPPLSD